MDDEELGYASLQEILYRVDTGNYEYRFVECQKSIAQCMDLKQNGLLYTRFLHYDCSQNHNFTENIVFFSLLIEFFIFHDLKLCLGLILVSTLLLENGYTFFMKILT